MHDCPQCAAPVEIPSDVMAGEIVSCVDCASELEVRTTVPLALALAPEIEEDWGE